ncbi:MULTISPECIES: iron chelate uptake ABC transporter family permease subunit [unclassified Rathayibacter]|uniref:FecCD family ABC transporter permease n=1 Tax=unclassified Rathayibacter TaxID=2609250 RepID=UPI000F4B39CE|nr:MULTISPECIES: iron chelate uptake ABC transporter family permease subunit [unclassified Rathayibacter]ROP50571.1 iron complex transport system permease protein [Rathayibacter sp. PhB186]ROS53530.1 iron complex transport system permease protein [Rathayibacter sp. PhB185]
MTLVLRGGPLSLRVRRRTLLVGAVLAAAVLALAVVALGLGELPLSAPDVVAALLGQRSGIARTVVVEWRLPRVLGAVLFGAALGVAGAVFQSLTRNPLASPDIIGLTSGSYAGGLLAIIVLGAGAGSPPVAAGSVLGGLIAAALVYLLAYRRGVQGFRLIVVGIGVSAMLEALSTYLVLRAKLEIAMVASVWGAGSLNPVGWDQLLPAAAVITVALAGLGLLGRPMRQLELGDDAARALGTPVERTRVLLVIGAVALTAAVTAACGPIAFVALAAPQIARRLARTAGIALIPSALVGALVLLGADTAAQHVLPGSLPVGVVTVVVGGLYLVGLLIHEARRRS